MSFINYVNFETNDFSQAFGTSGDPTVVTSPVFSGTYAARLATSFTSTIDIRKQDDTAISSRTLYSRLRVRFDSATANDTFISIHDDIDVLICSIFYNATDDNIIVRNTSNGGEFTSAVNSVPTGVWHKVEIYVTLVDGVGNSTFTLVLNDVVLDINDPMAVYDGSGRTIKNIFVRSSGGSSVIYADNIYLDSENNIYGSEGMVEATTLFIESIQPTANNNIPLFIGGSPFLGVPLYTKGGTSCLSFVRTTNSDSFSGAVGSFFLHDKLLDGFYGGPVNGNQWLNGSKDYIYDNGRVFGTESNNLDYRLALVRNNFADTNYDDNIGIQVAYSGERSNRLLLRINRSDLYGSGIGGIAYEYNYREPTKLYYRNNNTTLDAGWTLVATGQTINSSSGYLRFDLQYGVAKGYFNNNLMIQQETSGIFRSANNNSVGFIRPFSTGLHPGYLDDFMQYALAGDCSGINYARTLFIDGTNSTNNNITLWIGALGNRIDDGMTLFLKNPGAESGMELSVWGEGFSTNPDTTLNGVPIDGSIYLYIGGQGTEKTTPLYINAATGNMNNSFSLYTKGHGFIQTSISGLGGGSWTPSNLSTVPLFWGKNEETYEDTAGTIPALTNDDPVALWKGGLNNIEQGINIWRGKYKTNVQNGLPIVQFNPTQWGDTTTYLQKSFTLNQPEHLFIVMKQDALETTIVADGSTNEMRVYNTSNDNLSIYAGGAGAGSVPNTTNGFHIYSALFNGTSSELRQDGGSDVFTGDVGSINGGGLTIGAGRTGGSAAKVSFGEVILYNINLSDPDRQKIEGYLAWKWGLVSNLPSDHPYKTSAPTVPDIGPTLTISSTKASLNDVMNLYTHGF